MKMILCYTMMNFVLVFLIIHNRQRTQKITLSQHLVKMLVKEILEVHLSAQLMGQQHWLGWFLMEVDVVKQGNPEFMERLIISKNGSKQVSIGSIIGHERKTLVK